MADNRITSRQYDGVYYRLLKRKYKGKPDRSYSYTLRDSGKKRYINAGRASEGMTEAIAYQLRLDALTKLHRGENVAALADKKSQTLNKIMDAYMAWRESEGEYASRDWSRYNKHIKPTFGALPISSITLALLDKFKAAKTIDKANAPSSVKKMLSLMRAAINYAISRKLCSGPNPVEAQAGLTIPKEDNRSERFLAKQEAHDLLEELERRSQQLRDMAFVALYTGMRSTEIFGLRGADIDAINSIATFTAKGRDRETVSLRPRVLEVLQRYITRPDALLFPNSIGQRYSDVPDTFNRAVNAVGLNDTGEYITDSKGKRVPGRISDNKHRVTFHTLRHTFASWLAQSGTVTIIELKEAMRHKRIETTMRYVHFIPSEQHKKLALIDALMPD